MTSISAIIITRNEAAKIRRCLDSLQWCDEIIVLDSGSTDETVSICQEYTKHVYSTDWPGFGPQKNRALAKASNDWVISIDADEWLSNALRDEIQTTIKSTNKNAFWIRRKNKMFGQFIHHGEPGTDAVLRLFRRESGKFTDDKVHERVLVEGDCGTLKHFLLHETSNSLDEMLNRLNSYTTLSAEKRFQSGKKTSLMKALFSSTWAFIQSYIIKRGFMDGGAGFLVAIGIAHGGFYRYAKLYLLNKRVVRMSDKKIRVLHISTAKSWRGGEKQLAYLYEELAKQPSIEQLVLCRKNSALESFCRDNHIYYKTAPMRSAFSLGFAKAIHRLAKLFKADLIHTHDAHAHTASIVSSTFFKNTCPLVVSRKVDYALKKGVFSRYKYNHSVIKKIICVSDAVKEICQTSIHDKEKCVTVHDGVNIEFPEFEYQKDKKIIIGTIAALTDQKDPFTTLKIAHKLKDLQLDFEWRFYGEGELRKEMEAIIERDHLGSHVKLMGFVNNIQSHMANLDMVVMPSKKEGLCSTLLDVMLMRKPIVASNVGGIPEIIEHGFNGLLAEVGNAEDFTKQIFRLINDPSLADKITENSARKVLDFSKEKMAARTLAVYESIVC